MPFVRNIGILSLVLLFSAQSASAVGPAVQTSNQNAPSVKLPHDESDSDQRRANRLRARAAEEVARAAAAQGMVLPEVICFGGKFDPCDEAGQ